MAKRKVFLKNRQLPSSVEGIAKKLLLLYTGPYAITQDKGNNTYELSTPDTKQVKGVYDQAKIKKKEKFLKSRLFQYPSQLL